jgi:hypothetical protein
MDRRIDVLSSTELSARGLASRVGEFQLSELHRGEASQTLEETRWLPELARGLWSDFRSTVLCLITSLSLRSKAAKSRCRAAGIRSLAAFPKAFCKLSGLVVRPTGNTGSRPTLCPILILRLKPFGASRSMIGSDWPVCLVASSYSRALDVVRDHLQRQPVETRDPVLGGNAQRFWRLKA